MSSSSTARAVWQVSGGPTNRAYAEVFLRYGVALIGPGDAGAWRPDRGGEAFEGPFVRRFATELRDNDILLLRIGMAQIVAIGLVGGDYIYLNQFDDVNGWDLQHARRVRWYPLPSPYRFDQAVFGANPPRLSRVQDPALVTYAERFVASPPIHWQTVPLPILPAEEPSLETAPLALQHLVAEVADLASLYDNPRLFGESPAEGELVAHVVVPFLRALGWPPERIALEWHEIDVALFASLPRTSASCRFVIEAKRIGASVEGALTQALGYITRFGLKCDVIVTDGIRYRLYDGRRDFAPVAYANLARLKQSATDFFVRLRRP